MSAKSFNPPQPTNQTPKTYAFSDLVGGLMSKKEPQSHHEANIKNPLPSINSQPMKQVLIWGDDVTDALPKECIQEYQEHLQLTISHSKGEIVSESSKDMIPRSKNLSPIYPLTPTANSQDSESYTSPMQMRPNSACSIPSALDSRFQETVLEKALSAQIELQSKAESIKMSNMAAAEKIQLQIEKKFLSLVDDTIFFMSHELIFYGQMHANVCRNCINMCNMENITVRRHIAVEHGSDNEPTYAISYTAKQNSHTVILKESERGTDKLIKKLKAHAVIFAIKSQALKSIAYKFEIFILEKASTFKTANSYGWHLSEDTWVFTKKSDFIWEDLKNECI